LHNPSFGERAIMAKIRFMQQSHNELDATDILQMIEKRRRARGYRLLD